MNRPKTRVPLSRVEKEFRVHDLEKFIDYLTSDPSVPIEKLAPELRHAVLVALTMEHAHLEDSEICYLIRFLLEQRRLRESKPEVKTGSAEDDAEISAVAEDAFINLDVLLDDIDSWRNPNS